jgi:hypothetical protein
MTEVVVSLTRKGRRALKSGIIVSPLHRLIMLVCAAIGDDVVSDNMESVVQQLIAGFGSAEKAIDAINHGRVGFARAN